MVFVLKLGKILIMCINKYYNKKNISSIPIANYSSIGADLKNVLHNSILLNWAVTLSNAIRTIVNLS